MHALLLRVVQYKLCNTVPATIQPRQLLTERVGVPNTCTRHQTTLRTLHAGTVHFKPHPCICGTNYNLVPKLYHLWKPQCTQILNRFIKV
jgi:hypothetical protein